MARLAFSRATPAMPAMSVWVILLAIRMPAAGALLAQPLRQRGEGARNPAYDRDGALRHDGLIRFPETAREDLQRLAVDQRIGIRQAEEHGSRKMQEAAGLQGGNGGGARPAVDQGEFADQRS
jgi:hypothetical protein